MQAALRLRADVLAGELELIAPSLWLYEIVNGLLAAERRRRLAPGTATQDLVDLLELTPLLVDPDLADVHRTALRHSLSGYDASYVALATQLGLDFWTGDRRIVRATASVLSPVRWIGDYPRTITPSA